MLSQDVYRWEITKYFNKAPLYFFVNGKENSAEFDIHKNKIENKYFINKWCTHTFIFYQLLIVHKLFKLSPLTSVYHLRFSSERSRQTLHCHHLRHISFSSWLFLCIVGGEKKFFSWFVHSFSIKGVCIFLFYLNITLSTHKHSLTNTHTHKFKYAIQAFHLSITL